MQDVQVCANVLLISHIDLVPWARVVYAFWLLGRLTGFVIIQAAHVRLDQHMLY
jgi:hypothetical protein